MVWQALGLVLPDAPPLDADPPDGEPLAPRPGWHPLWLVLGPLLLLTVTVVGGAGLVRAPYVVYAPGSATETEPAIAVPGTRTYDTDGSVLFLTVSLRGASKRMSFVEAAYGWLRGDQDVYPRRLILGDQTGEESRRASLEMMQGSQVLAAKVALEHLGYEVPARGAGVVVNSVVEGAPAAEELTAGDVIVGVDGVEVTLDTELRELLADKGPGDTVDLRVQRGRALRGAEGEPETEDVTVEMIADPEDPERALIGITTFTLDLDYDLPFPVEIDAGDVGGPSAGLALTLGILDRLTPGSITGGRDVAVTGEIQADGTVAVVGGVAQKTVAAKGAGVDLILVPAAEAGEARAHAGDIPVVGVDDLEDALVALAELGGNALELPQDGDR